MIKASNKILNVFFLSIALLFLGGQSGASAQITPQGPVSNVKILGEYFDQNIPGFSICSELRRLTEDLVSPTVTPPYEVGKFSVDTSSAPSGGNNPPGSNNGSGSGNSPGALCQSCIASGRVWCADTGDLTCYSTFQLCKNVGGCSRCIQNDAGACPADTGNSGGNTNNSGGGLSTDTTAQGSIFQKWFVDACVMDGYLTAVKHVDTIHRFEVEGSQFAEKLAKQNWSDEQIKAGINLGQLFEEALMEVTRMPERGMRVDRKDLQLASLKDFFLVLKDSNEQFMTDLLQAISEKEKLSLDSLKEYELAKIEKAREDVNKLTYEVYRELKEEPLIYQDGLSDAIVRSLGLRMKATSTASAANLCPFGVMIKDNTGSDECVVIKKEGRVIQNADDFINEEAVQKARDFLMCFFAPWRHFPIGEDYYFASTPEEMQAIKDGTRDNHLRDGTDPPKTLSQLTGSDADIVCGKKATAEAMQQCPNQCPQTEEEMGKQWKSNTLKKIQECRKCIRKKLDGDLSDPSIPACNSQYICDRAFNAAGIRPDMFEATVDNNPQSATYGQSQTFEDYKKKLCPSDQIKEDMKRDMLFALARKYKFIYNAPPEHWYYYNQNGQLDKTKCALILANLGYDVDGIVENTLGNQLKDNMFRAYKAYQERSWKADLPIALAYRPDATDSDYNNQAKALTSSTGFGVQSFAQNVVDKIISDYKSLRSAEYIAGEGLRSEKYLIGFPSKAGKYYFIDTENIISPAVFLKEKIAAATQAQFDLAQKAFKQYPEGPFGGDKECPEPQAKGGSELTMSAYQAIKADSSKLEHGWYLVNKAAPGEDKDLVCIFPQFNDLTGSIFGEIKRLPHVNIDKIKELPAPWEDFGDYMKVPQSYLAATSTNSNVGWLDKKRGLRKAPPAFNMQEYYDAYGSNTLDKVYPEIYKKAYGENVAWPQKSNDFYTNKWYKDLTQIYEKPMSEILKTWFKEE